MVFYIQVLLQSAHDLNVPVYLEGFLFCVFPCLVWLDEQKIPSMSLLTIGDSQAEVWALL